MIGGDTLFPCLRLRVPEGGKQCVGEQLILDELVYVRFSPYTNTDQRRQPEEARSFDVRATDPSGNVVFARKRRRSSERAGKETAVSFTANVDGLHQICVHNRAPVFSGGDSRELLVSLGVFAGGEAKALLEEHKSADRSAVSAEVAKVALAQHGEGEQLSSSAAQALRELQLCGGVSESVHREVCSDGVFASCLGTGFPLLQLHCPAAQLKQCSPLLSSLLFFSFLLSSALSRDDNLNMLQLSENPAQITRAREREADVRAKNSQSHRAIWWSSVASAVVFMALGTWQVLYLRRFFSGVRLLPGSA